MRSLYKFRVPGCFSTYINQAKTEPRLRIGSTIILLFQKILNQKKYLLKFLLDDGDILNNSDASPGLVSQLT
jgi:hypothetical protein